MIRGFTLIMLSIWTLTVIGDTDTDRLIRQAQQHEADGEFQEAADTWQSVASMTAELSGNFDIALFEPLMGQGRSLSALGQYEDAMNAFQNAQNIVHRNEGVFSVRQLAIVEELTAIALQKSEPLDANTQQKFAFIISRRSHNNGSLEALAASHKLVNWYIDTGQFKNALNQLKQIQKEMELTGRDKDPVLIDTLILAAKARRLSGICCSEKNLQKVLEILKANPDLPSDINSRAYHALADAFIVSQKPEEAAKYYTLAQQQNDEPKLIAKSKPLDQARMNQVTLYNVISNPVPGGERIIRMTRDEQLSSPFQEPQQFLVPEPVADYNVRIIDQMNPTDRRNRTLDVVGSPFRFYTDQIEFILPHSFRKTDKLAEISITLDFTVQSDGTVQNVEIIESNAPRKLDRLMRDVLLKSSFRPALDINGLPVNKDHVSITQMFINKHSNES